MPVTARLSKNFYDRSGDQIANELVEWFNQVDATYRSDLRGINELNFARFEARMGQQFAELETRIARRFAEAEALNVRRFAEAEASNARQFAELRVDLERGLKEQTRYLLLAVTAQMAAIMGLYFR